MAQTPDKGTPAETKKTEEVRQQVRVVRDDVRELGRAAKGAAGEVYDDVKRHTGDFVEAKKQRVTEFEDQIVEYVRQKPLQSVLIAVGAGALLGFLLTRRESGGPARSSRPNHREVVNEEDLRGPRRGPHRKARNAGRRLRQVRRQL